MNSTLKSLLFWIVLIGVGILIWNFSQSFQKAPAEISFSTFFDYVDDGSARRVVSRVRSLYIGDNLGTDRVQGKHAA